MKNQLKPLLCAAACVVAATGCIHHTSVVHRSMERVRVEFENETAGRIFYEKLSKMPQKERQESRTSLDVPFVFGYERKVISDNNDVFNQAVHECDANGDGKITEVEARIFAGRP